MFLTRFSTRQDLAFLNPSCMLRQFICTLPGPPVSNSTFGILHFYVWVLSGVPCSSMQASCQLNLISSKLGQTIPEVGEANPWKFKSSSLCLFSPGPYLIGVLQGGPWRDQSPLTEIQGCDPTICLLPFPQYPKHHHLHVAAAKTALTFTSLTNYSLLVSKEAQQSMSPHCLPDHLCQVFLMLKLPLPLMHNSLFDLNLVWFFFIFFVLSEN